MLFLSILFRFSKFFSQSERSNPVQQKIELKIFLKGLGPGLTVFNHVPFCKNITLQLIHS